MSEKAVPLISRPGALKRMCIEKEVVAYMSDIFCL